MAAPYVPDPATREAPVQEDEIRALVADGGRVLRDRRAAAHFLNRVLVTLEGNRRDFASLHRQVAEMRIKGTDGGGTSGGLDPWAAARFLPQEEFDKRASMHLRSKLDQADMVLAEITDAQRKVVGRVNAIKYAIGTLLDDPSVPQDVKDRFLALVRSVPDGAAVDLSHLVLPAHDDGAAGDVVADDVVAGPSAGFDAGLDWAPPEAGDVVADDVPGSPEAGFDSGAGGVRTPQGPHGSGAQRGGQLDDLFS